MAGGGRLREGEMKITITDPAYRAAVLHLYGLGVRPLAELLAELARCSGSRTADHLGDLLAEYQNLTPKLISAADADGFPPMPTLRLVVGGGQ